MNPLFRSPGVPITTQAAEGLPRRRWTLAEIEAAAELGVFDGERFELIGGDVVPMSAKGLQHELVRIALIYFWVKETPDDFRVACATTFRMSEDTFFEPDFVFYRLADGLINLSPSNALLVVEVAEPGLSYDLERKARLYATFGVAEVWIIDAARRVCHIHAGPGLNGYQDIRSVKEDEPLPLPFAAHIAISLSKLEPV